MSFLLDTDICSAHLKNNRLLFTRLMQHQGQLFVSVITVGELQTWARRSKAAPSRRLDLERLMRDVTVLDVTRDIANTYGTVRAALLDQGLSIATADGFIAATAVVHNFTLVTHNTRDFQTVAGLHLVDWLVP